MSNKAGAGQARQHTPHPNAGKTDASEFERMTVRMGLSEAQANRVLEAIGPLDAVGAATLALSLERRTGDREKALELALQLEEVVDDRAACQKLMRSVGLHWKSGGQRWPLQVQGAIALLTSTSARKVLDARR